MTAAFVNEFLILVHKSQLRAWEIFLWQEINIETFNH